MLLEVLGDWAICSKEWICRQYDHEVQGYSGAKPFAGPRQRGPGDGSVVAPKPGVPVGFAVATGLTPRYSLLDPAAMAEAALDEALRNVVVRGGDPGRCAVLDNYCWGSCDDPEQLGRLVRATEAICELALHYRTPFISGKDSLNNEFRVGERLISIPGCLLVSALAIVPDIERVPDNAFVHEGSALYLLGTTRQELGGSAYLAAAQQLGNSPPRIHDMAGTIASYRALHESILDGQVASAHDLAEGGLAVALSEMAIGAEFGAGIELGALRIEGEVDDVGRLFGESLGRILVEAAPGARAGARGDDAEPRPALRTYRHDDAGAARRRRGRGRRPRARCRDRNPRSRLARTAREGPARLRSGPGDPAMTAPHALVLKAPGTNCDFETLDAFERAGATTELVTTHDLFAKPERLLHARILCFPGGFAHGDDIASARVLANQMRHRLGDTLLRFVEEEGGYVLGICNGFQALVKLGLLPRTEAGQLQQEVSLVHNASGQYECRWIRMQVADSRCAFLPKGTILEMPIGHGEGKFVAGEHFDAGRSELVALRYLDAEGKPTQDYPCNPNGSTHAVAGLTDPTGRVLGLMPHPDRSYLAAQHPRRLHEEIRDEDMAGHQLFAALVTAASG